LHPQSNQHFTLQEFCFDFTIDLTKCLTFKKLDWQFISNCHLKIWCDDLTSLLRAVSLKSFSAFSMLYHL
jgi:hypothetical protein